METFFAVRDLLYLSVSVLYAVFGKGPVIPNVPSWLRFVLRLFAPGPMMLAAVFQEQEAATA